MSRARARERAPGASLFGGAEARDAVPAVVAGIDEAGLGPLLGPLAIGWCALAVEGDERDPWRALAPAVAAAPAEGALCVADSKVVFERSARGARRLETTALAFLEQLGGTPRDGAELLRRLAPRAEDAARLASEPWQAELAPALPRHVPREELVGHARALASALERARIALVDAGVRLLGVAELNASFARTGSKHRTQWEALGALVARLWERHAARGLDLVVDRQGGRQYYAALVREALPDARVTVLAEAPARSSYRVESARGDGRWMALEFRERGERSAFAVALASCLAKHARETCMDAFNAWFARLDPRVRPTAGYVSDARRWLTEASPALYRAGIAPSELVRLR